MSLSQSINNYNSEIQQDTKINQCLPSLSPNPLPNAGENGEAQDSSIRKIDALTEWDIIDELLIEPLNPIDGLLNQFNDLILYGSDNTLIILHMRIAKLFNYVASNLNRFYKDVFQQFDKVAIEKQHHSECRSSSQFDCQLLEFAQIMNALFRYIALLDHTRAESSSTPFSVLLSINESQMVEIVQFILLVHRDESSHDVPFTFKTAFNQFFRLLLNLPKQFEVCQTSASRSNSEGNVVFEMMMDTLLKEGLKESECSEIVFELITQAYLTSSEATSEFIAVHLSSICYQLDRYFDETGATQHMNSNQTRVFTQDRAKMLTKILRLLSFVSASGHSKIRFELLFLRKYHVKLYNCISVIVGINGNQFGANNLTTTTITLNSISVACEELAQSMVILIGVLLAESNGDSDDYKNRVREFMEKLLDDCIKIISQQKFAFFHSILLPILNAINTQTSSSTKAAPTSTSISSLIPLCLHPYEASSGSQVSYNEEQLKEGEGLSKILRSLYEEQSQNEVNQDNLSLSTSIGWKRKMNLNHRIDSRLLNRREQDYLHAVLMDSGLRKKEAPMKKKEQKISENQIPRSWKKVAEINRSNSIVRAANISRILKGKKNTVFVFNCLLDGEVIKIVVTVTAQFREVVQAKKHSLDISEENVNIRATSNAESVFMRFDESKMIHMRSTCRTIMRNESEEPTEAGAYKDDMKTYVLLAFDGLTFYFDDKPAIHINFNNVDLSNFDLPFWRVFTGRNSSAFQDTAVLLEAEIWSYGDDMSHDRIEEEENRGSLVELFEDDSYLDFTNLYAQELQKLRFERVLLVPGQLSLKQLIERGYIQLSAFRNGDPSTPNGTGDAEVIYRSSNGEPLNFELTLKSIYEVTRRDLHSILDLNVSLVRGVDRRKRETVDVDTLIDSCGASAIINNSTSSSSISSISETIRAGLLRVFKFLEQRNIEEEKMNLRLFYGSIQQILRMKAVSGVLLIQSTEFISRILKLEALIAANDGISVVAMKSFHGSVGWLLSVIQNSLNDSDHSFDNGSINDKIDLLNFLSRAFETYSGIRKVCLASERGAKMKKKNADGKVVLSASAQIQNGLSNRGVGYGNGGSDMTWTQNYDGMVEAMPETAASSSNSNDLMKKQEKIAHERTKRVPEEELNEFAVMSKYMNRSEMEGIVRDIFAGLLGLFSERNSREDPPSKWIEAVQQSNLHIMIIHYLEIINVSSEASSEAKENLGLVIELVQRIAVHVHTGGMEDFLIWKANDEEDHEESEEPGNSKVQGEEQEEEEEELAKFKTVYSLLIDLKKRFEFIVESAGQIQGILSFGQKHEILNTTTTVNISEKEQQTSNNKKSVTLSELIGQIDSISKHLESLGVVVHSTVLKNDNRSDDRSHSENNSGSSATKDEITGIEVSELPTLMPSLLQSKCVTRSPFVVNGHHYSSSLKSFEGAVPTPVQVQRMVQEITGLQNSLEAQPASSIFICYDESNMNVMRCLVFGAAGTPYAHGAFVYDMLLPLNYPQSSPSVNLTTTGSGSWRFNPNLYHCGKVCLSLLGTWRGATSESWNPKISSIVQLLLSLQAIVMSEYIYFNEPGYEGTAGTEEGEKFNTAYSNIVKLGNIRFAMIESMRNPLPEFKEIIQTTFYLKKHMILKECEEWLAKAVAPALYSGLVASHNPNVCEEIAREGYAKLLEAAMQELNAEFESLRLTIDKSIFNATDSPLKNQKKRVVLQRAHRKRVPVSIPGPTNSKGVQVEQNNDDMQSEIVRQQNVDCRKLAEDIEKILLGFEERDRAEATAYMKKKETVNAQEFSELSEGVKDRWSRYIGVMGLDSVKKQSSASVLIVGLDHVGVEVAKNIALSGVKVLGLADNRKTSEVRRSAAALGQFFLFGGNKENEMQETCELTVAESSVFRLRQLNEYVECCVDQSLLVDPTHALESSPYSTIVLVNQPRKLVEEAARACRKSNIACIVVDNRSVFSRIITDFGSAFTVIDSNGEPSQEYTVNSIREESSSEIVVELKPEVRHNLSVGSVFELREVIEEVEDSLAEYLSLNGQVFTVNRIINKNTVSVTNVGCVKYARYVRNGIIKEVKLPVSLTFDTYAQEMEKPRFDASMCGENSYAVNLATHVAFNAADAFVSRFGRTARAWNIEDAVEFYTLALNSSEELKQLMTKESEDSNETHRSESGGDSAKQEVVREVKRVLISFAMTMCGYLPAQGSVLGGIVAQEVIKSITQKWMPIQQVMVYNCEEILSGTIHVSDYIRETQSKKYSAHNQSTASGSLSSSQVHVSIHPSLAVAAKNLGLMPVGTSSSHSKYDALRVILGEKNLRSLAEASTFVVGAGAIGCELLKNLAMGGFAIRGDACITITDPDVIENSNLNRQFLFRTSHITLPKASVSAAAAMYMNSDLKNHVQARLEKVFEGSERVFSDAFLEKQRIVLNALDNVQARQYVDKRCVSAKIAMIDSGTLGSKGHVQVVVPYLTESYGSQADPADDGTDASIPQCTLKMFPENAIHCMEWAKDKFGRMFAQKPSILERVCAAASSPLLCNEIETKVIEEALDCLEKRPRSLGDCIRSAIKKFYKAYNLNVQQLLHVYPVNHRNSDGTHFWTLPKRPPRPLTFDRTNATHMSFVVSFAKVKANVYRIKYASNPGEVERILDAVLGNFVQPIFVTNEDKVKLLVKTSNQKPKGNIDDDESASVLELIGDSTTNSIPAAKNSPPQAVSEQTKGMLIERLLRALGQELNNGVLVVPEEFEKDNDKNCHVDLLQAMTNCRAENYALAGMEWMDVKIKAGRITPALVTTTAIVAGLQTLEAVKLLMSSAQPSQLGTEQSQSQQQQQQLARFKNSFINISLPSLVQSEPFEAQATQLTRELKVTVWDRWDVKVMQKQSKNNTIEKLFAYFETEYSLLPRDLIQGAKPIYIHALMTAPNRIKENGILVKQDLLTLLTFKNKGDKYIEVILTFSRDKYTVELLKGTPTVRLYFL